MPVSSLSLPGPRTRFPYDARRQASRARRVVRENRVLHEDWTTQKPGAEIGLSFTKLCSVIQHMDAQCKSVGHFIKFLMTHWDLKTLRGAGWSAGAQSLLQIISGNDLPFDGIALFVPYFCECSSHAMSRELFRKSKNPCSHSPKARADQAMQALHKISGRIAIVSGMIDKQWGYKDLAGSPTA